MKLKIKFRIKYEKARNEISRLFTEYIPNVVACKRQKRNLKTLESIQMMSCSLAQISSCTNLKKT